MNTKTSKMQLKIRQYKACRIELADLGLNFHCGKSVSLALVGVRQFVGLFPEISGK